MKRNTKYAKLYLIACFCCIFIALAALFIGGLSYSNPTLDFYSLYKIEPIKNFIFTLLPSIK
jgi:TRAP-type C4-dicarboxylate transport system permease small subunit